MHEIILFIKDHELIIVMVLYWFFSAAVSAMPMPTDKSTVKYTWLFGTLHTMSGSVGRVMAMRYPGMMKPEDKT